MTRTGAHVRINPELLWNALLPWSALRWRLPLINTQRRVVAGIVVHKRGQFGWNRGDWVNGGSPKRSYHFGLDIIGWISLSGRSHPLDEHVFCCSPLEGVVTHAQADEHNHLSVIVRHAPDWAARRRFSFFGDLEEMHVKKGERVTAGAVLGLPWKNNGKLRFFHFGIGYELEGKEAWNRIYINPGFSISGEIQRREKF